MVVGLEIIAIFADMKRFNFVRLGWAICALVVAGTALRAGAQKIYSTGSGYDADLKVYVTDREYRADLVVYRTDREYRAKGSENKGIWFFTERRYNADKKVFFVDHEYQADLVVYFTDREYRAGWKKPEKRYLLY